MGRITFLGVGRDGAVLATLVRGLADEIGNLLPGAEIRTVSRYSYPPIFSPYLKSARDRLIILQRKEEKDSEEDYLLINNRILLVFLPLIPGVPLVQLARKILSFLGWAEID